LRFRLLRARPKKKKMSSIRNYNKKLYEFLILRERSTNITLKLAFFIQKIRFKFKMFKKHIFKPNL